MLRRKIQKYAIRFFLVFGLIYLINPHLGIAQNLPDEQRFSDHKFLPAYGFKKLFNTNLFQGNRRKSTYFEGWYFKMVSKNGSSIFSVIPGISLAKDGKTQHAFIQVINGVNATTTYYSFPIEQFSFSTQKFAVRIGANYFSSDSISLAIPDSVYPIFGVVKMKNTVKYTHGGVWNPGIMGWYRFVPFMECYHGVVSLSHQLEGALTIQNQVHEFSNGKGYIEKDWGSSMPSSWIWMQSNNFFDTSSSFMLSVANIPWLGKSFTGFLGFFHHQQKNYNFATYRPSRLKLEFLDSTRLAIHIKDRKHRIQLEVKSNTKGLLNAPVQGAMDRRIPESIDAEIKLRVWDKKGNLIAKDSTQIAGLEMVGDYFSLPARIK